MLDAGDSGGGGIIWSKQTSTYNRAILNNQGKMEFGRSTADDASGDWLCDVSINNTGRMGIGTDSADEILHLYNSTAGDTSLKIETSSGGDPTLYLTSETVNRSGIISFQDNGVNAGRIIYSHNGDTMDFYTGGTGSGHLELSLNESSGATFRTTITAGGDIIAYSDKKLKKNIKTLDGSKVFDMRGVSFTRKDTGRNGSGVIAQELQKIAPELVLETNETLGVAYGNLTGYLIEAVKELKAEIDELKKNNCNCNCKN